MKSRSFGFSVATGSIFHLATTDSRDKPLCGDLSPDAEIGSYVERVDTSGGEPRWVREVLGRGGQVVAGCGKRISLYPSELKQILPFAVIVTVRFEPNEAFSGYDVHTSGIAQIENKQELVKTSPQLNFITAKWLYNLQFGIGINANAIVPWINKANRG